MCPSPRRSSPRFERCTLDRSPPILPLLLHLRGHRSSSQRRTLGDGHSETNTDTAGSPPRRRRSSARLCPRPQTLRDRRLGDRRTAEVARLSISDCRSASRARALHVRRSTTTTAPAGCRDAPSSSITIETLSHSLAHSLTCSLPHSLTRSLSSLVSRARACAPPLLLAPLRRAPRCLPVRSLRPLRPPLRARAPVVSRARRG